MRISVVIPLLNEEQSLPELYRRLDAVLAKVGGERQIIFVDDGSTDRSADVIRELAARDATVRCVRLSRNFGHEAASTAGLDAARGDAVVLMDADLQDPPELIGEMVAKWREGCEIVYAVRTKRHGEPALRRGTAWVFYRLLRLFANVDIPKDAGDFRLIDAKVVDALRRCREQDRFVRGLIAWTGFRTARVHFDRPARFAGETKYRPVRLFLLAMDAAFGFSIIPLRVASAIGFLVTVFSAVMAIIIALQKLFHDIPTEGYALLATGLFFLGGVQMLLLGILGEYIGRIYRQTQQRPLYVVAEQIGGPPDA